MVNPGTFRGARKDFLIGEKAKYSEAVSGGYEKDALADIQRRFFKHFPIDLPLDEEPTAEYLASIDDDEPDTEPVEPDKDKLGEEEYVEAMANLEKRKALIHGRKKVSSVFIWSKCANPCLSRSNIGLFTNT